ncbi:MAG: ABC transporter permease [Desulfobulbus sp.]|nr:ABC transporter permease [Desulfobulbus sp.]
MPSLETTSFFGSLRIQGRVIWALLMREIITRYGRNDFGFLWMFLAPMLFMVLLLSTRASGGGNIHGLSIIAFFITGYCAAFMLRKIASRGINAVEPNRSLMYHRNVRILDIYTARLLLEMAGESMAFFFLMLVSIFMSLIPMPDDTLKMLLAWGLLAWFGSALAIILGSLNEMYQFVEKFWQPTSILLFVLSGAFFMVDWFPEPTRSYLLYLPWIHSMELLREGYFGSAITPHYDLGYSTIWNLGLTLFGLLLMRSAANRTN